MTEEFAPLRDLLPLLRPRGIAVVGASVDAGKFSTRLIPSLVACGYAGVIYPVNPRYTEVAGLPCHASVADLPGPCDLVIIAVPAGRVAGVVADAARQGVRAAIILSAGFAEVGGQGASRTAELRALAGPMRIYGPNCPGLWQIRDGLVYTFSAQFAPEALRAGPIGLVTQGGALGRTVLDAMATGLGFSYWFSTGNEADLDAADFVSFLADDAQTHTVALIVEGWRDGRRFLRAVARCRQAGKPVVVLKIGRTAAGGRAAAAHTGASNGSGPVAAAALRRAGCICVEDVDELTGVLRLLARHGQPGPGGLGICSFSGGAGGLLADLAQDAGVDVPPLDPATGTALADLLPDIASVANPTDLTTAVLQDPALARRALELLLADPAFAAVLFPLPHRLDAFDARMAAHLAEVAAQSAKPAAVVALSPVFPEEEAAHTLQDAGVIVFPSARLAVRALSGWLAARDLAAIAPYAPPPLVPSDQPGVSLATAQPEAIPGVLRAWGVPTRLTQVARDEEHALALATAIGYPVECGRPWGAGDASEDAALLAPDPDGLRQAWRRLRGPGATPPTIWLAAPAEPGLDLRCGLAWDAAFGPVIECGLGGRWRRTFGSDQAFRLAPFDLEEALAMLRELRCFPLLEAGDGASGPYDAPAAARILVQLSQLAAAAGPFAPVAIDALRVLAAGRGALALDAGPVRA